MRGGAKDKKMCKVCWEDSFFLLPDIHIKNKKEVLVEVVWQE